MQTMINDIFDNIDNRQVYRVKPVEGKISGTVCVPGSKSMTNRALLMAAIAKGKSVLEGVLFSDDSRHFLDCLITLGFEVTVDEKAKIVTIIGTGGDIPVKQCCIDVGSAGTAARFLTAFTAFSDGKYTINCSEQMKKRPMKPLFDSLVSMGAKVEYIEKDGYLPAIIEGNNRICSDTNMDISESTQFLSALLMVAPLTANGLRIRITSERKDGAYIRITREMMEKFGAVVKFDGESYYCEGKQDVEVGHYIIEPDVSAACYFYSMAAITGGTIKVRNVTSSSMQGDLKYIYALKKIGCIITEESDGIVVTGPKDGIYDGIDIDMKDYSDQTMTMAVVLAMANTESVIRNVGHIRLQECDRMNAIVTELNKVGIYAAEDGDDIIINPKGCNIKHAIIETYEDHRVAMAFTLLGLRNDGIIIDNPLCCKKTFEEYYFVLEKLLKNI